jgi:hypothetical protein
LKLGNPDIAPWTWLLNSLSKKRRKKGATGNWRLSTYGATLATLTLIILFSKTLKFSKLFSFETQHFVKEMRESLGIF